MSGDFISKNDEKNCKHVCGISCIVKLQNIFLTLENVQDSSPSPPGAFNGRECLNSS